MEPTEIQARATIAAALIMSQAVEVPTIPDKRRLDARFGGHSAAGTDGLRLPGDYESKKPLIFPEATLQIGRPAGELVDRLLEQAARDGAAMGLLFSDTRDGRPARRRRSRSDDRR